MKKLKKNFIVKITAIMVSIIFLLTAAAYAMNFADFIHLRKPLDYNDPEDITNRMKTLLLQMGAKRPFVDNSVNKEQAEKWINAHPLSLQKLVRVLVENITCISQGEFEQELKKSVSDFRDSIGSRPYILLRGKGLSERWTYEIAVLKGLPFPKAIVELSEYYELLDNENVKPSYIHIISKGDIDGIVYYEYTDYLTKGKRENLGALMKRLGICDIVIIDDASYSGIQLEMLVDDLLLNKGQISKSLGDKMKLHWIIPFLSSRAEEMILGKNTCQNNIYKQRKIESISEILDREDDLISVFEKIYPAEDPDWETVTYFSHKVPDFISFLSHIAEGVVKDEEGNEIDTIRFIPETTSPYADDYLEKTIVQILNGAVLLKHSL